MLSAAVFIVMLSVIMLSVIMLSVILLSVIMLSVIMLSVIMLSVIMLSVILLSVIMLSVAASTKLVCFILENISAQIYHFLLRIDAPLSYLRFLCYLISA
jgi:hypothetical protein